LIIFTFKFVTFYNKNIVYKNYIILSNPIRI